VLVLSVLTLLAWGAFSFGAVYAWAYLPLALGCAAVGGICLLRAPASPANRGCAMMLALGFLIAAVLVQLLPVSIHALQRLNPTADQLLRHYDIAYGTAVDHGEASYRHTLSVDGGLTRTGLLLLIAFGGLLVGLLRGLTRETLEGLVSGLVLIGSVLALVGMAQRAMRLKEIYGFWQPLQGGEPFGPFVNHNHFAGWMLMAIPVGLGYLCALIERGMHGVRPHWRNRLLWFATPDASRTVLIGLALILMGVSLVMTLSRGGIGCLILAVALSGAASLRHQSAGARRQVYAVYLVILLVAAVGWVGVGSVTARFAASSDQDINGRLGPWTDAISIAQRFPLTGSGLNTYGVATLFYQRHDLALHYDQAHNDYLQLAAEGGVLLGIPILLLIGVTVKHIWRSFRDIPREGRTYWIKVGAVTGLLAIGLQEIVDFSLQMPGNAVLFVALCAIAMYRPAKSPSRSIYRPAHPHRIPRAT
jgi:O-antigen ligase